MNTSEFQEIVWDYAASHTRSMPWRDDTRPYYVLVSELMLQQTQVERVIPKFTAFIEAFPSVEDLAAASLGQVLTLWSGLGYNRRAKFLWNAAQQIVENGGIFPSSMEELIKLPGVGKNTAGAIMAYAYNQPVVFVETNIRTVYFHHFFSEHDTVTDNEVLMLLAQTMDKEHPREWYWALMDYGTHLKKQGVGRIQKSQHYRKQTPLKGSLRETRGKIISLLTADNYSYAELAQEVDHQERFDEALAALKKEGMITFQHGFYTLK